MRPEMLAFRAVVSLSGACLNVYYYYSVVESFRSEQTQEE